MKKFALIASTVFALAPIFSGCASTEVKSVWKDPEFHAKIQHVLVVGVTKEESTRRTFEDRFVAKLKEKGIDATSSYRTISAEELKDKEEVQREMSKLDMDAVVVSRVVDVRKEKQFVPPSYGYVPPRHYHYGWHDYYRWSYPVTPGYSMEYQTLAIETNLYDAASGKLVWSARSDAYAEEAVGKIIEELTGNMANRLVKSGLIE